LRRQGHRTREIAEHHRTVQRNNPKLIMEMNMRYRQTKNKERDDKKIQVDEIANRLLFFLFLIRIS
jgi:hypothetical protein